VTFTIESGPGEFLTGSSITFNAESDIPIRDGTAAIEFRSYFAGETLIRATSPGLDDATIRIVSLGTPKFVPGTTPSVKPRPYKRFSSAPSSGTWDKFGLENPTRASSEMPDQTGRQANDGNFITSWRAGAGDAHPWLRIDLERVVMVKSLRLNFPDAGSWRCRVEVSPNGESDWKVFVDSAQVETPNIWTAQKLEATEVKGRYVRLTLLDWPKGAAPGIAELAVSGTTTTD
jgi:beta-galactosidase